MASPHFITAAPPAAPAGPLAGETTRRPPGGWTPEEFAARFPALAGKPDLDNHPQIVEAIGYRARGLLLNRRQRWTRVERQAIEGRVTRLKADAGDSLDRARAIWSELLDGRVPQTEGAT